jgi:hypothetical protein
MLNRKIELDVDKHIYRAPVNVRRDPISKQCQISFIIQCIQSAHPKVFDSLEDEEAESIQFPVIDRLDRCKPSTMGLVL